MFRKIVFILLASVFILFACDTRQQPWNPIFEATSFRYLDHSIASALASIDSAEARLRENRPADAAEALEKTKQICLALKDYYIPLTEIRHQIYDADRFFYLGETDRTKHSLETSRQIIIEVNRFAEGAPIHSALRDLVSMIDGCILSLDENTGAANNLLKNLGHKVNLMLIKGGLTLSDMTFS